MFDESDEATYIPQLQNYAAGKDIDAYEINLKTTEGDAPATQRNPLDAGMVSGTALGNRLIEGMNLGLRRQLIFDLSGYNDKVSPTLGNVFLWGITRDLTAAGNLRPTGLAMQMLNSVVAGDFYQATLSGIGASGLRAAAFLSPAGWAFVIASQNPSALPVQINVPANAPPPTSAYSLSASTITTDNETGTNVQIVSTPMSLGIQVTVPPYGLVVLKP